MHPELLDLLGLAPRPVATLHGVVTEAYLADLLGIPANRLRTLTRDGVVRRVAPARYDQREAIRSYCAHLRQHAAQAGRPSVGGDELKVEKIRVARQQADKLEMANSIVRGEMLPAAAVAHEWASVLRDVRAGLLAVPSRVSIRLGHLTAHDLSEMDLEIRSVLTELAGVDDA